MRVWTCIVTAVAKIQEKTEKVILWYLSKNSVTRVVFLGGIRALVKVPQSDREFSFGNWLSKMSTPKDFVDKIENHRALTLNMTKESTYLWKSYQATYHCQIMTSSKLGSSENCSFECRRAICQRKYIFTDEF